MVFLIIEMLILEAAAKRGNCIIAGLPGIETSLIALHVPLCYLNWSERLLVMEAEKVLALEVDLVKSSITGSL